LARGEAGGSRGKYDSSCSPPVDYTREHRQINIIIMRRTINEDPPLLVGLPPALVLVVGVVLKQIIVRKQLVSSLSSLFPGRREEVVGIYDTHEESFPKITLQTSGTNK